MEFQREATSGLDTALNLSTTLSIDYGRGVSRVIERKR